ncbi:hypothetical protein I552_0087 [Mycobacterium xenopi 3993]|nr:hypothetical protein I552_0087 [Mycobacterium xenopi 3993]
MVGTSITRRPVCRSARLTWLTSRGVEYTFSSPTLNFGALLGITASAPLRRRRGVCTMRGAQRIGA